MTADDMRTFLKEMYAIRSDEELFAAARKINIDVSAFVTPVSPGAIEYEETADTVAV
ncbi:MAG: hypothetical protein K2O14_00970 [Oscillospiraceae bacterium]|nr:hypothetical protein [Oscillospiraceae bacterium]